MLRHKKAYILPASPWWGGFYERFVRTVKSCLKKTQGRAYTTFEELQTILYEVEVVINSRPLAYVSDDDLNELLTPFHLMHGRGYGKLTKDTDLVLTASLGQYKNRLKHQQKVVRGVFPMCTRHFGFCGSLIRSSQSCQINSINSN